MTLIENIISLYKENIQIFENMILDLDTTDSSSNIVFEELSKNILELRASISHYEYLNKR